MKFKIGDEVLITAGKDKGKKGKIEKVLPSENKLVVAGINMYKKNSKATGQRSQGGIIDIIKPLSTGNLVIVCPKCKLPTRVAYTLKNDKKSRICKKCDQIID